MPSLILVRKDSYFDSVLLMRISRELQRLPGINDAAVVMGTPQNKALLQEQGYEGAALDAAHPNDLIIAVRGENVHEDEIEEAIARLLKKDTSTSESRQLPRTLKAAVQIEPDANLALISVPGIYAAREARNALRLGLHVMLFSDNVSVEDEIALKKEAVERGLLMMGPDCGTAIINGKPLGFGNVVRRGNIGIVGASGTGIQEVTCCIHRLGGGISQAIGTGGRDLSDKVGGLMTVMGVQALLADPDTEVIVIISKPPASPKIGKVFHVLLDTKKPTVVHIVGHWSRIGSALPGRVAFADSLADTAARACSFAGIDVPKRDTDSRIKKQAQEAAPHLRPGANLRGLFCGGTTAQEALAWLSRDEREIRSNLHKVGMLKIDGLEPVSGDVVLDLGADEFTVGRPHPMIEPQLRNERLAREMQDPNVGILLFDCVLGYGSHPDPAGVLAEGFLAARRVAEARGAPLVGIASLTGTPGDPQGYDGQRRKLEEVGILVAENNVEAVQIASEIMAAQEGAR